MNKKGSMELSVNSIVILVIAITILGLVLAFVSSQFGNLEKKLQSEEPSPPVASGSEPITVSRSTLVTSAGDKEALKFSIMNNFGDSLNLTANITCKVTGVVKSMSVNSKSLKLGEVAEYSSIVTIGAVSKDMYLCSLSIIDDTARPRSSLYSMDYLIEVK